MPLESDDSLIQNAPTRYIEGSNGVQYAYRRFGTSDIPLVFHNHFRGNMDWDPVLMNGIARKRQVILFDNRGVGRTHGIVPDSAQAWADDMIALIKALGLEKVDLFGYSMGGRAVQKVALTQPSLVRKMVLAAASAVELTPDSPKETRDTNKYVMGMATAVTYEESKEGFKLALFGETTEGAEHFEGYWSRLQERKVESLMLDPVPLDKGGNNQIAAVLSTGKPENVKWPDRLAELKMPVLVANGNNDLTLGRVRTLEVHDRLRNSQLVMYPNSGHGFLWQYAALFAEQVNLFLDNDAFDSNT